jgi:hypothetical protein
VQAHRELPDVLTQKRKQRLVCPLAIERGRFQHTLIRGMSMAGLAEEKAREQQFRDALEQFETCAGAPLIEGEMPQWIECVDEAIAMLKPRLEQQLGEVHRAELVQIRRTDQEMYRHVEELQAEDQRIAESFRAIQERLPILRQLAERVEPDEKRAAKAVEEFADNALKLVMQIRKQEVAFQTWLMEAFTRDRGVAD